MKYSDERKDAALAETAALLALRKKPMRSGGRGRMTSGPDREHAVALVDEACANGARVKSACAEVGIGQNTYRRWARGGEDARPLAKRPTPAHALSDCERAAVLAQSHRPCFASLPPAQIIPQLTLVANQERP